LRISVGGMPLHHAP